MESQRFQYYAFISYSHADEKWAKWLHKKLENYKLPNTIRKESGGRIPKYIRPVFRDQTDLGLGSLQQSLRQELMDSRFLIIIASPNSAKSYWVNREIQTFQELGRGDRIIPFIVKGFTDAGDEDDQCYPPAMRTKSGDCILGASLEELSPEQALIKIIAAVLGLKYDQLYNRHLRRERKKKQLFASTMGFLLVTMGMCSYGYWDYNRIKVEYFAKYIEKWGIPEGIIREVNVLMENQQKQLDIIGEGFQGLNVRMDKMEPMIDGLVEDMDIIKPMIKNINNRLTETEVILKKVK